MRFPRRIFLASTPRLRHFDGTSKQKQNNVVPVVAGRCRKRYSRYL